MDRYRDFEDFLAMKHAEQYVGLDDDSPDSFDEWISNLDSDDWIKYGNAFALDMVKTFTENLGRRMK